MSAVYPMLLTAMLTFFLVGSLLGVAVGAGLLARTPWARTVVDGMNRWVSTRRVLRPVELPRDTGHGNRGVGVVLVVAGAYALLVLAQLPIAKVAAVLHVDTSSALTLIAIETAQWLLLAGCAVAVATGMMLLFFPRAWRAVEDRANRWYSTRKIATGGDDMHVPLDRLAQTYPRAAGALILVLSLASTAATAALLSRL